MSLEKERNGRFLTHAVQFPPLASFKTLESTQFITLTPMAQKIQSFMVKVIYLPCGNCGNCRLTKP